MQNNTHRLEFIRKKQIASGTYAFFFSRPQRDFDFLPGQYISITVPVSGESITHDFSIASSPFEKTEIAIITKQRKSQFKDILFAMEPGTHITFSKPSGGFVLDEKDANPKVFLAGGIGVVPLFNMVGYATKKELFFPLTLLASFVAPEEILYAEELKLMAATHNHVQFAFTITGDTSSWTGERGRISKQLIKKYVPNYIDQQYYLAGSPNFVIAMEEMLEAMGVGLENIKLEQFTGY